MQSTLHKEEWKAWVFRSSHLARLRDVLMLQDAEILETR